MSTTPPPSGPGYGTPPPPSDPSGPGPGSAPGWSVGKALNYGLTKFLDNLGQILLAALLLFLASIIGFAIGVPIRAALNNNASGFIATDLSGAIGQFVYIAIVWVVQAAIIRGALDITEGRRFQVSGLFSRLPIGNVLLAGLLVSIITAIGTALFFIPGVIAWFLLLFTPFFVVDRDMSAVDAMKASVGLATKNLGNMLVWVIVGGIVYLLGYCILCIGFIVTGPIVLIGAAYTYKKFTDQPVAA